MGKGDKKSKRGKIILGSYGVRRSRKKKSHGGNISVLPKTEKVKSERGDAGPKVKVPKKAEVPVLAPEIQEEQTVIIPAPPLTTEVTEVKEPKAKAPKKSPETAARKSEKKEEKAEDAPSE
jgi:ribosomal small subunit protein bTHX